MSLIACLVSELKFYWCGTGSSTAVSSTLGSSNPVLSTIKFLIGLFDHFC